MRGSRGRGRYHHGDLRRVLLDAATGLIRQRGVEHVSLRAIAREAHVSHAAPYHHFADLDGLLATVAASGFTRLRESMLERAAAAEGPPLGRLQEAGVAYVLFAAEEPELYRLMFSGRLRDRRDHPELAEASAAAYEALDNLLGRGSGVGYAGSGEGPGEVARAAWALVHGLATLLIDGRLDIDPRDTRKVEDLVRRVTRVLGRGLPEPDSADGPSRAPESARP